MAILDRITVGERQIIVVDTDPTISGVTAPLGSIILLSDGTGLYLKSNTSDTNWSKNVTVGNLTDISSVGTITSGTWNGSIISPTYGGTGVNNSTRSLTINTNSGTIDFLSAASTLTVSATSSISGTNTGDQTTITGNAGTATALQTPRTINGVSFDGTANITVTAAGNTLTGTVLSATITTSSLQSVGTITFGTWNGTVIGSTYGGTGVNNGVNTITLGGSISTASSFTTSGANALTLTTTGSTNVTLPTTGTLVNTAVTTLSSLVSVGTITTGTWNASVIQPTYGGTGVNNGANTITLGGSISTASSFTTSGANALTLTTTGSTNVTLPTTGTLVNTAVTTLSSLVSVGTITTGTWSATSIAADKGGTGQSSYAVGDILYANTTTTLAKLSVGTNGRTLKLSSGIPAWVTDDGSSRYSTASGTDTYTATFSPVNTALTTGATLRVKFTNANTGASTLNVDSLGAVAIRKNGIALVADDIIAGATYTLNYDGTFWQIISSTATMRLIQFIDPYSVTSGTAHTITVTSNTRLVRTLSGSNLTNTSYMMFVIPPDFVSFPTNAFSVDTARTANGNTCTVTFGKAGAADATMNALNLIATSTSDVFETKSGSPTSTYAPGDRVLMTIVTTTNGNTITRLGHVALKYIAR